MGAVENGVSVGGVCKKRELIDIVIQNDAPVDRDYNIPRK